MVLKFVPARLSILKVPRLIFGSLESPRDPQERETPRPPKRESPPKREKEVI